MTDSSMAFARLAPEIQKWIYRKEWTNLREIQEKSVSPILAGNDVIISSGTASGKTEAAFLPICSSIAKSGHEHLKAIYIAPLKALINDQERRLSDLCSSIDTRVTPWHGDVSAAKKRSLFNSPNGVLLITPESLEAMFVLRGSGMTAFLAEVEFVVIDELHSFIGSERGRQLQSLLHRSEIAADRRIPRIALSATLGDLDIAADFLRPGHSTGVTRIQSNVSHREVKLQIRGYEDADVTDPASFTQTTDEQIDVETAGSKHDIAEHMFKHMYNGTHLVFCNSRSDVEIYADLLTRICDRNRVPNHFLPHHGSLSRELRSDTEAALQSNRDTTAVATTTLEMGIDIGQVDTIAQVGPPPTVASLKQRLGRSGRRNEDPSIIRIYVQEPRVLGTAPLHEQLHMPLVQSVAMVQLMALRWIEPPDPTALHLSTLVQQILSQIAQYGGIRAGDSFRLLCTSGPFGVIDQTTFGTVLRDLAAKDLIAQTPDGTLVLGLTGEKIVNQFDFYASFETPAEWRLLHGERVLGTMPISEPLVAGTFLIYAGRRWKIAAVDEQRHDVELTPHHGGKPPRFSGTGAPVHERVMREMYRTYADSSIPPFVNPGGISLLEGARSAFSRLNLSNVQIIPDGKNAILYPWLGSQAKNALKHMLETRGLDVESDRYSLEIHDRRPSDLMVTLSQLYEAGPIDPVKIAETVENLQTEKHHRHLRNELLARDYASSQIDSLRAWEACGEIVGARTGNLTSTMPI